MYIDSISGRSGSWLNSYWGKLGLQSELTVAKHLLSNDTLKHLQKRERPNIQQQRVLQSASCQWQSQSSKNPIEGEQSNTLWQQITIWNLFFGSTWTIKTSQEFYISAQTPSPSFPCTLTMSLQNPGPSLGFGKWGHCAQLHLEVGSGSVLVPWVPGPPRQRLRATSLFRTQEDHHWDRCLALGHQRVHVYGSTNLTLSFINKWRRFPLPFPTVF